MLRPTLGLRSVVIPAVIAVLVIGTVLALFLVLGFTSPPFDVRNEMAIGKAENSLGEQYSLSAARLTSTWTLNREADVVLRVGGGSASVDGVVLAPGCYSGTAVSGTVISFADATDVSFVTPGTESTCLPLP